VNKRPGFSLAVRLFVAFWSRCFELYRAELSGRNVPDNIPVVWRGLNRYSFLNDVEPEKVT
jgi:hypothetical protein